MYSKAVTKVLNRLVDTSRVGTEADKAKLLSNIKLLLIITAYLDKETLWEMAHAAGQEFVRQFATVEREVANLQAYTAAEAPEQVARTPINPLPLTNKSQATYYEALGTLISKYRPRAEAELNPEESTRNLRRALLACFECIRLLKVAPEVQLSLFTDTLAERLSGWVDIIQENTNEVEIVEELGALRYLVGESESAINPVTQKYSGVISVVEDTPATIDIQDGPYIFESAAAVSYTAVAGGPALTWNIAASEPAIAYGGPGPWNIIPGFDTLVFRLNNVETPLTLTAAVYAGAAALAVEINTQLGIAGITGMVADGSTGLLALVLDSTAAAEGMQLYVDVATSTFPDHGLPEGWVRGAHSSIYGGPTVTLQSDVLVYSGDAVLNIDGTITVSNADPILDTDLVRVEYQEAGPPLEATYGVTSIITLAADQTLTLESATLFLSPEFEGVPRTSVLVPEVITVEILRRNKVLTNSGYLWVDACTPLGIAVATEDYATGEVFTTATTPTPPLRRGDQVVSASTTFTLRSLNPYRLDAGLSVATTSAVISSGMAAVYGPIAATMPRSLLDPARVQLVREAAEKFSDHMVFATWEYFSQSFAAVYLALQALSGTLSGIIFPTYRLPRIAALLQRQHFETASAMLLRGDIGGFLALSASTAMRGQDVAQEVRDLLNTYRDSGQTSS